MWGIHQAYVSPALKTGRTTGYLEIFERIVTFYNLTPADGG
jgi:hypothetical protein